MKGLGWGKKGLSILGWRSGAIRGSDRWRADAQGEEGLWGVDKPRGQMCELRSQSHFSSKQEEQDIDSSGVWDSTVK